MSGENNKTDNNIIYTEAEYKILEKSKNMRLEMVDAIFKETDGAPTHSGTVRVVNEVLTSLDKTVNDAANARLKHQENENLGAIHDTVAEVFKRVAVHKTNHRDIDAVIEVTPKEIPNDIVVGETAINPEQLSIDDFTNNGDD